MQNSESFTFSYKITRNTPDDRYTKNVEMSVPLNYSSNFWGNLEMPLINCEINLILTWSENCFCSWSNQICNSRYKTTETIRISI